ncbi:MAG: carbohydrate-binding protein, partial [Paludibacteraceae bacterium]|nr:carbohydrate-binding protein [Paludibacteraceae bacterium]
NRNEGVDASPTAIGFTQTGEWLEYTVDIQHEDEYIVESRVASGANGAAFTFYLDNNFIVPGDDGTPGGFVNVPNTGDWVDIDCFTFRCVNPTGVESISAENGLIPDGDYSVYDIAGRFVKKITVSQNSYKNILKRGFYILRNSKGKNYTLLVRK